MAVAPPWAEVQQSIYAAALTGMIGLIIDNYLRAVGRKVLWSSACVCLCVCVSVRTVLSARYLKNGFMDHHQIWWVGAGGEPLEQVQFWC